LQFRF